MTSRFRVRLMIVGVVAGIAVVAIAIFVMDSFEPSGPGLTKANFAQIKPGMTVGQIVALLGEPSPIIDPQRRSNWMANCFGT